MKIISKYIFTEEDNNNIKYQPFTLIGLLIDNKTTYAQLKYLIPPVNFVIKFDNVATM